MAPRAGFEHTTFHSEGECANRHTTNASLLILGIATNISFEDEDKLKKLFDDKHGFCFNGQASKELKKLIIEKQMEKEEELSNVKSKIQEFKILEAFGESAPQFILQACAILNRLITEKIDQTEITSLEILKLMLTEVTTTEILTLTSSYLRYEQ